MATQQLEQVLDRLLTVEEPPRALDETQLDPIADGWTVAIWSATADLFGCRYFHREEGERDRAGRMRLNQIRHCVIGAVPEQVAAKVMAEHFCATVRRLARGHARETGGGAAARRAFETGCAARLTQRLSFMPGVGEAGTRTRAAAIVISSKRRGRRTNAELVAEQAGTAAGDGISLVVRSVAGRGGGIAAGDAQMGFAF